MGAAAPGREPRIVVVVGGKGATGDTTLAMNCAYAFGQREDSSRASPVDAPCADPDLDLRLGGCRAGHDLSPFARLDQLVLHLVDVWDGATSLDSCLFTTPELGFQCLLAPHRERRPGSVGREQMDYLFEHLLQPGFGVIVVDAGRCLSPDSGALRFWLEKASVVLIPTGSGESHRRNCARSVSFVEQNSALPRGWCLAVTNAESGQAYLQRQLALEGIEMVGMPRTPRVTRLADARRVPMALVHRSGGSASAALAERLTRMGRVEVGRLARSRIDLGWGGTKQARRDGDAQTRQQLRQLLEGRERAIAQAHDLALAQFLVPPQLGQMLAASATVRAEGGRLLPARSGLTWMMSRRRPAGPGRCWLRLPFEDLTI